MRVRGAVLCVLLASAVTFLLWACGKSTSSTPADSSTAPSAPSPAPAGPYSISGLVADLSGSHPVPNAAISVTAGSNAGRATTTDANGRYTLAGLQSGSATIHASADGFAPVDEAIVIPADKVANFRLPPNASAPPATAGTCDPSLWPHMHDVQRIKIVTPCQTVTGVIASVSTSDDGDYDMQLTLDPGYGNLLNAANVSKLNGNLQIEAICQAPIHSDVPDALRTCANFIGTVPIPPVGAHVQVTGVYVLDSDHGWMEIHPISALARR
jgi:Carboxypeptidase regulatory-like domain